MQALRDYVNILARHALIAGMLLVATVPVLGTGMAFAAEAPAPGPELAVASPPANGPDTAFSTPSGWVSTVQGANTWYAFQYAGDKSQILIDMQVYPSNAASFTVWTPQNAQGWRQGQTVTPVGAGSPSTLISSSPLECQPVGGSSLLQCPPRPTNNLNNLIWSGDFNSPGIYYVVVAQSGPPGGYNVTVAGTGVATAGTPAQAPATATPAPQATSTPAPALGAATPATSTVPSGNGPDTALSVPGGWVTAVQGANTWYAFGYAGDKSQILIDMQVSPAGAATFTVWTPQNAQGWRQGQIVTPVGAGSPNPLNGSNPLQCQPVGGSSLLQCPSQSPNQNDLVWSSNFNSPGTYYVVVAQSGPPGGYDLTVTGTGVTTAGTPAQAPATAALAAQATSTPAPALGAAAPATSTLPSGAGPDSARSAPSGWVPTVQGAKTWYAFGYAGDKSQILIDMPVSPANAATFTVWTPQNAQGWRQGQTVTPVGAGSPNPLNTSRLPCQPVSGSSLLQCGPSPNISSNDLVWSGNFNRAGIYYVVVAQSGPPGGYSLTITGTGVIQGQ
jgi:hypothetical protein